MEAQITLNFLLKLGPKLNDEVHNFRNFQSLVPSTNTNPAHLNFLPFIMLSFSSIHLYFSNLLLIYAETTSAIKPNLKRHFLLPSESTN